MTPPEPAARCAVSVTAGVRVEAAIMTRTDEERRVRPGRAAYVMAAEVVPGAVSVQVPSDYDEDEARPQPNLEAGRVSHLTNQ